MRNLEMLIFSQLAKSKNTRAHCVKNMAVLACSHLPFPTPKNITAVSFIVLSVMSFLPLAFSLVMRPWFGEWRGCGRGGAC